MSLYLDDGDVRLYHGDALTVLQSLPAESVHMCVTSPPFFGLRDYQTGRWDGGDPDCDHQKPKQPDRQFDSPHSSKDGRNCLAWTERDGTTYGQTCGKCGARRVDQQIGLEETPEQWVEKLVQVFREIRRVLRPDGTLWLEVGDTYATRATRGPGGNLTQQDFGYRPRVAGCKEKDLVGSPWMLAFALRADGWYLRSDIVWAKPNPMPESVTDRPTKSHSYIFLLAKQPRYYWDQEALREPHDTAWRTDKWEATTARVGPKTLDAGTTNGQDGSTLGNLSNPAGRNVRSVWTIATQPYPEAHFATFPEELARRCILAGTLERGCCPECGASWVRQVGKAATGRVRQRVTGGLGNEHRRESHGLSEVGGEFREGVVYETIGWRPSCTHDGHAPCVVLDPFVGSGTVPYVARLHGRHAIGIDLSHAYLELAARRLQQLSLFA